MFKLAFYVLLDILLSTLLLAYYWKILMFKKLKNKTNEILRIRHIIAFIVMIISLGVSVFLLFPFILMFASGHDGELNWLLFIIIPTFCLFLLASFYDSFVRKEIKKRIENDSEKI